MRAYLWLAGPITALQQLSAFQRHASTRTALRRHAVTATATPSTRTALRLHAASATTTPSTTSEAPPVEIYVCTGRDCLEDGSRETLRRFKALKDEHGLDVKLRARPCMGPCGRGPNIDARRAGVAVKSPGTGVTLWTDVASDRECATILAAAGEQLVPENYESAPPRTFAESASKFYRGYWKQINNVLFACTLVGAHGAHVTLDAAQKQFLWGVDPRNALKVSWADRWTPTGCTYPAFPGQGVVRRALRGKTIVVAGDSEIRIFFINFLQIALGVHIAGCTTPNPRACLCHGAFEVRLDVSARRRQRRHRNLC